MDIQQPRSRKAAAIERPFLVEEDFIKKIDAILEQHLSGAGFEVSQLSKEQAMSHSNLFRKIKALTLRHTFVATACTRARLYSKTLH